MRLPLSKGARGIFCVLPAVGKGFYLAKTHKTQRIYWIEFTCQLNREKRSFFAASRSLREYFF
jgi:hypothetical protein